MSFHHPLPATDSVRIAVVIPVYNAADTISSVITGVQQQGIPLIVVDEASTDTTPARPAHISDIDVVCHTRNRGKGAALQTGFSRARERGFTHAITMDGSGRHDPADIPLFVDRIHANTGALCVGYRHRNKEKHAVPLSRRIARRMNALLFTFNTGVTLHDPLCGFRAWPLEKIRHIPSRRNDRLSCELEHITLCAVYGIPVVEVPIREVEAARAPGFNQLRDFAGICRVHARAALQRSLGSPEIFYSPGATRREKLRALVKHELTAHTTTHRAALSLGIGVFIGIAPIYGLQTVTGIAFALWLKLNRPLTLLGTSVSSPPLMPVLVLVALYVGNALFGGGPELPEVSGVPDAIALYGPRFLAGACALAGIGGVVTYCVAYSVFAGMKKVAGGIKKREKEDGGG